MNADRAPLPKFWYFPRDAKAALVMTGDDHGNDGTAGRFDNEIAASAPGCDVAKWECVRSTSYIYPNTPLSDSQAASYQSQGFEVALHPNTGCSDYTASQYDTFLHDQLADFATNFPSVADPVTNRNHCIAWSGWADTAKGELDHGMRLDANYYYWPAAWLQDRPGMFTGSGMPMRFADTDGSMIDVYQAATEMTDESGQTLATHIATLLDNALGSQGYYGAFTANMHTDNASHPGWSALVSAAQSRGVPIVSAKQMLDWVDARNASSFGNISWAGDTLSFTIDPDAAASGLRAMVPLNSSAGELTAVERNGSPVTTTTKTVKGVDYAFIDADAGSYSATYAPAAQTLIDDTVADFSGGNTGAGTYVSETDNGEVTLKPTEGSEFSGSSLPSGWSDFVWNAGGAATVAGGKLTVDGARAGTDATYGSGRALEFEATFPTDPFAHIGFGVDYNDSPWAMFSVKPDGNLYARTDNHAGDVQETSLGSGLLASPHDYRIEWGPSEVRFYVDGSLAATHTTSFGATQMRPLASDYNTGGGALVIDWLRMTPYPGSGTFTSRVFDGGATVAWGALNWTEQTPAGTSIALSVRTGDTPSPDGSWSGWTPIAASGDDMPGTSRYAQYKAELVSGDADVTPTLSEVVLTLDQTPVAVDDSATVDEDSGPTTIDVLANDTDSDGGPKTITAKTNGAHGTVTITHGGADLTYEPDPDYCNSDASGPGSGPDDTFTYTLNGGSAATVSVHVNCLPELSVLTDDTVADFSAGNTGPDTTVTDTGNGELTLKPTEGSDFSGSSLPSGWSQRDQWNPGGSATVSGGNLVVDGASAGTDATYGPGRTLEFEATFSNTPFAHAGFGVDYNTSPNWAMFSVKPDGNLYARSNNGSEQETSLGTGLLDSPHTYRIEWDAGEVRYFVDGGLVATHTISFGATELRPLVSDYNTGGGALTVNWLRMTPYPGSGTFTSRVFDAGSAAQWGPLTWESQTPAGTSIAISVRTGDTASPDGSWSGWTPIAASGDDMPGTSRYAQYRAELTSSNADLTPILSKVVLSFELIPDTTDPTVTINRPYDGGRYSRFANPKPELNADYSCHDADSGIASCVGTVADGDPFDRSSTGTKTFTVTATDNAGNTHTESVTYKVFSFAGLVKDDHPLAYYRLGDGPGATTMADSSGHGHDGTYKNGQDSEPYGVSGDGDSARRFTGADGYGYANGITAPRSYTLSTFFSVDDASRSQMIVQHGSAGAIYYDGSGHRVRFRPVDWNGLELRTPAGSITPGSWHHIAASYKWVVDPNNPQLGTGTAKLYLDGQLVDTGTADKATSGTSTFYAGYGDKAPWLAGNLDELAYFDKALSATHIHEIWLADPPAVETSGDPGPGDTTTTTTPDTTTTTPETTTTTPDTTTTTPDTTTPSDPAPVAMSASVTKVTVGKRVVKATYACGATRACSGKASAVLILGRSHRALGHKSFSAAAGGKGKLRFKLTKKQRKAVKKARRRHARVTLQAADGRRLARARG